MKYLQGTYGIDAFSIFLLLLSVFLNFGVFSRILSFIIMIYVIYRAFSKDIYKRSSELNKFLGLLNKISPNFAFKFNQFFPRTSLDKFSIIWMYLKNYIKEKKKYKIVKCPNCNQKLRLPRGKGKIVVTCKKCAHEFKMKS